MTDKDLIRELALVAQKMLKWSGVGALVVTPQVIVMTPVDSDQDDGSVGLTD